MSRKKANLCPQVLTGNGWKPSPAALGVLRHLEYTEPVVIYEIEKPESADTDAEGPKPLFNERALFPDYYLNELLPGHRKWEENTTPVYTALGKLLADARCRLAIESKEETPFELIEPAPKSLDFKWQKAGTNESAPAVHRGISFGVIMCDRR